MRNAFAMFGVAVFMAVMFGGCSDGSHAEEKVKSRWEHIGSVGQTEVFATCDHGNRVYVCNQSFQASAISVVPNGCKESQ